MHHCELLCLGAASLSVSGTVVNSTTLSFVNGLHIAGWVKKKQCSATMLLTGSTYHEGHRL